MKIKELPNWVVPTAFLLKVIVGMFFLYVYSIHYGRGALSADAGAFMRESKMVYEVFAKSPIDYFKLLTGIGETDELIMRYLPNTYHWDVGNLTIINDSKNVLRVHSVIHFFSFGNEFIHMMVMSFLSLLGIIQLYKSFRHLINLKPIYSFSILVLIPSTLFWTSGILKEPMMFFGLALVVRGLMDTSLQLKRVIFLIFGTLIMILFKPYVLICLIPAVVFFAIYWFFSAKRLLRSVLISIGMLSVLVVVFPKAEKTFTHYISRKQFDFDNVGKGGIHVLNDSCFYYFKPHQLKDLKINGSNVELLQPIDAYIIHFGSIKEPIPVHLEPKGEIWRLSYKSIGCASYIETTMIQNSTQQLLLNIPEAILNSTLRPFPGDPGSWLKIPAMLELWIIFITLAFTIYHRRKLSSNEQAVILSLFIFAVSLFLLIGWTTPVIGAIARYRFPAQLALVLIGLILYNPPKILRNE